MRSHGINNHLMGPIPLLEGMTFFKLPEDVQPTFELPTVTQLPKEGNVTSLNASFHTPEVPYAVREVRGSTEYSWTSVVGTNQKRNARFFDIAVPCASFSLKLAVNVAAANSSSDVWNYCQMTTQLLGLDGAPLPNSQQIVIQHDDIYHNNIASHPQVFNGHIEYPNLIGGSDDSYPSRLVGYVRVELSDFDGDYGAVITDLTKTFRASLRFPKQMHNRSVAQLMNTTNQTVLQVQSHQNFIMQVVPTETTRCPVHWPEALRQRGSQTSVCRQLAPPCSLHV